MIRTVVLLDNGTAPSPSASGARDGLATHLGEWSSPLAVRSPHAARIPTASHSENVQKTSLFHTRHQWNPLTLAMSVRTTSLQIRVHRKPLFFSNPCGQPFSRCALCPYFTTAISNNFSFAKHDRAIQCEDSPPTHPPIPDTTPVYFARLSGGLRVWEDSLRPFPRRRHAVLC